MPNFARISFNLVRALGRLNWDRKKLREYQDRQLRRIVCCAYDYVPFYRRVFRSAGFVPSDVRGVDDLGKLPIVRKSDMKRQPETDLISREFSIRDLKVLRTGGSTGEPFSVYLSEWEDDWRKAVYLRANVSCGQRPWDRWVAVLNAERSVDTAYVQHAVGIFAQKVVPVVWNREKQLSVVERLRPDVLDGFSSALWLLAREARLRGVKSIRPRIMFGSGELISVSSRIYLEEVFSAPFFDQFGCTEIDRSAWQCPERFGYHMDVDSVITQFVNGDGEEVGDGERGEIVYTSLFNYAMPFIRYGVRDVGIPVDDECACGRKLPLMRVVEGRSNSFLVFPDGSVVSPMSFIEILRAFELVNEVEQYCIVQQSRNLVEILVKKAYDDVDEERVRKWLLGNVLEGLPRLENVDLSEVRFEVKFVDDLPTTKRGKLNVVVSNVEPFS